MKFRIESLEHFALHGNESAPGKQPCPSAEWDNQRQFWTVEVNSLEQLSAIYAQNKYELVTQFEPSADGDIVGTIQLMDCCPDSLYHSLGYTIDPPADAHSKAKRWVKAQVYIIHWKDKAMCNFIVTISETAKKPHALLSEDSTGTEQIFSSCQIKHVLQAAMSALVSEDQTGLLLKDPCRRLVPKDQWNDDDVVSGDGEVWIPRDHLALILNVLKES